MKRSLILIFTMLVFTSVLYAQDVVNADFVSPMNEEMVAVKKGSQWGFMNTEGNMVINFRDDLVASNATDGSYPIFYNGRCLIMQKKDGIPYYGYIDTSGKTVIDPQYLNATNFKDNRAIALHLNKTVLSTNALNKQVVNYGYHEVVINLNGDVVSYLAQESVHITLTPENLRKAPVITAKPISGNLFAVMNAQKKWSVVKVD